MNKSKEIEKEFSKWAKNYGRISYSFWEGDISKDHINAQLKAIKLLSPKKEQNILDVGCGLGNAVIEIAKRIKPGTSYGVDITEEMIKKSRLKAKKINLKNVKFKKANAANLPFKNNFFNGAISSHVAHHFENPQKVFEEIRRTLKPKSKFVLVDTCASSKKIQEFEKKLKKEEKAHNKFLKLSESKKILKKAGFTNIKGYRKNHTLYVVAKS